MTRSSMYDFVPDYRRKFRLRIHLVQQSPIDGNLAAGKRPGIGNGTVQYDEFVWQFPVADRGEPVSDALHVIR